MKMSSYLVPALSAETHIGQKAIIPKSNNHVLLFMAAINISEITETDIAFKKEKLGWDECLMSVVPGLWEAKAGGSEGQEMQTILGNMMKPRLY